MAEEGWIKLYRSIRSNWLWEDGNERYLKWWVDILLMVNHQPRKVLVNGELVEIETGERLTSILKLSKRWDADRRTVTKFLDLLEKDEMVSIKKSRQNGTTLKVLHYADYQSFSESNVQRTTQRNTQRTTHKQELKELKNKDHENFEKLWKLYPKKEGNKKRAEKAYLEAIKNGVTNKEIQTGIVNYIKKIQVEGIERKYIAQGATWFFQNRWTDEYELEPISKTTSDGQRQGKTAEEITNKEQEHLKEIERRAREAKTNNEHRD